MKVVQCYELFGGIALKNHTFSFFQIHKHCTVRSTRNALSDCAKYTEHATPRVLLIRLDGIRFSRLRPNVFEF